MSLRSSQVANFLRDRGIRRGDCVLLMLGNEVALWESLLALVKIGAVVSPATGLLTQDDVSERIERWGGDLGITADANTGQLDSNSTTLTNALSGNLTAVGNLLGGTNGLATQLNTLIN